MTITKNIKLIGSNKKYILTDVFFKENNCLKPVLIFCHGYKGFKDWGAWNLMAEALAEAGFFFIKFNFSHNGGTAEQPIDFPDLDAFGHNNYTKELNDLDLVINWISSSGEFDKEADLSNISLMGHSRGGGIVILKAQEDSRIKNVISLAGVSDYEKRFAAMGDLSLWKKEGVTYVINGRTKQKMPHYYQFYEDFLAHKNRLNIERATKSLNKPLLIIHGDDDSSVLIDEAEHLHQWKPDSVFKIITGANHVFGASHPWETNAIPEHLQDVISSVILFLSPAKSKAF